MDGEGDKFAFRLRLAVAMGKPIAPLRDELQKGLENDVAQFLDQPIATDSVAEPNVQV
jgi:hypothetical protein